MRTLKQIYDAAGIEKPNLYKYKNNPEKYRQNKKDSKEYKLNNSESFYLSKTIYDLLGTNDFTRAYGNSFSDEATIYNEIYYSSKIEGVKVEKKSKIDKKSSAFLFQESYKYLLDQKEISHDTMKNLLEILSETNDDAFERMTEDKVSYRKDRVGVYKSGKNMIGELVHEGVDATLIKESMQNVFDYMNTKSNEYIDTIVEAAVTHIMFETIHPYYDGNGRIGRMLMFWFLRKSEYPGASFHLSQIIDANRSKYYESMEISQKTKNLDYFILYMFEVCSVSIKIESELQLIKDNFDISMIQLDFARKLMIAGIIDREISYPLVKEYFNDTHSKPAFFKMINLLVEKEIIKVNTDSKTNKYSLNKG